MYDSLHIKNVVKKTGGISMSNTTKSLFLALILSVFSFNANAECMPTNPIVIAQDLLCQLTCDPALDTDSDTVTNALERIAGTNLSCDDTDNDGLKDAEEIGSEFLSAQTPTVSLIPDDDGDGMRNPVESNTADADEDGLVDQKDCLPSVINAFCIFSTTGSGSNPGTSQPGSGASTPTTTTPPTTTPPATTATNDNPPSVFSDGGGSVPTFLLIAILGLLTLRKKF